MLKKWKKTDKNILNHEKCRKKRKKLSKMTKNHQKC